MPGDALHVYETRHGKLCVGVPYGEQRPAVWLVKPNGQPIMLGRLYGPAHAEILAMLLDGAFDEINEVITHLHGEAHGSKHPGSADGPRDLPRGGGQADGG